MPLLDTSMQDKVCLITGANSSIGKATALRLAQMGAAVVMVCRDRARGEEAQREIKTKSGNEAVDLLLADLSSQQARGTERGGGAEAIFMLLPDTSVSGRLKHTDEGGNR